ncbi:luciferin 4-monooxygenase-like isoform X2 [Onthophagus taurus]|uniref:luciferin 4-monooxygenase-like isoform X1 n=1 Tax=Onthophagus taurus TaxID=166361 RepID=UPI000C204CFF|nr:luciferin 4-monooxygenase-like [Onthophagus taurus]
MDRILHGPKLLTHIPLVSLGTRLFDKLKEKDDNVLFIDVSTDQKITNKEFLILSYKLAESLRCCGFKQNDVLVISGENSVFYYVPVVAGLFLGMISGFINQTYTKNEFLHLYDIYQPKIVFISSKLLNIFIEEKSKFQDLKIIILDDEDVSGYDTLSTFIEKNYNKNFCIDNFKPKDVNPIDQIAFITSSSGTTGLPKAVMITHDNISMRVNQLYDPRVSLVKEEIVFSILPFFHVFGLVINIAAVIRGNQIIMMKRFNEKLYLESIEKHHITHLAIVPTIAYTLVKSPIFKNYNVSTIEELFCGSNSLSEKVEEQLVELFPNLKCFRQGYGLTEATLGVVMMRTGEKKVGSAGKVVPGMSLCICDEFGKRLGAHERGEILIKGRMVTKGYYRNPEATKNSFVDGWLHTGDYGYYDEEGFVFIVDRLKDVIKYKGFQVSPVEIEGILISHPKVKAACVVGTPDELAGELPTGFVVKQPNVDVTEDELIQYVAERISKTKHLRGGIYFVEDLPKTSTGKIKRKVLRDSFNCV